MPFDVVADGEVADASPDETSLSEQGGVAAADAQDEPLLRDDVEHLDSVEIIPDDPDDETSWGTIEIDVDDLEAIEIPPLPVDVIDGDRHEPSEFGPLKLTRTT